jgi:hypothetical protein
VCFVVRKTTLEQEHTILTTMYLASAKKHRHQLSSGVRFITQLKTLVDFTNVLLLVGQDTELV